MRKYLTWQTVCGGAVGALAALLFLMVVVGACGGLAYIFGGG